MPRDTQSNKNTSILDEKKALASRRRVSAPPAVVAQWKRSSIGFAGGKEKSKQAQRSRRRGSAPPTACLSRTPETKSTTTTGSNNILQEKKALASQPCRHYRSTSAPPATQKIPNKLPYPCQNDSITENNQDVCILEEKQALSMQQRSATTRSKDHTATIQKS